MSEYFHKIGRSIGTGVTAIGNRSGSRGWTAWFSERCDTYHTGIEEHDFDAVLINNMTVYENDYIYYAESSFHIDAQYANKSIAWKNEYMYFSDNNSATFTRRTYFKQANLISMSRVFSNGNILFCTRLKAYLSKDDLRTYEEVIVRDLAGDPITTTFPKDYFRELVPGHEITFNGKMHYIWGNYANVGAYGPVRYYHTDDCGETITVIYQFGLTDPVKYAGDGDPTNDIHVRHVHAVVWNPNNSCWIGMTGDHRDWEEECYLQKIQLDVETGIWSVTEIASGEWYKQTGGYVDNNNVLYFGMDQQPGSFYGVFSCPVSDLANSANFSKVANCPADAYGISINEEGEMVVGFGVARTLVVIKDWGVSSQQIDPAHIPEITNGILNRIYPKNSNGWWRLDINERFPQWQYKTLFIKIK